MDLPSVPSWNRLHGWLQEMELLRKVFDSIPNRPHRTLIRVEQTPQLSLDLWVFGVGCHSLRQAQGALYGRNTCLKIRQCVKQQRRPIVGGGVLEDELST